MFWTIIPLVISYKGDCIIVILAISSINQLEDAHKGQDISWNKLKPEIDCLIGDSDKLGVFGGILFGRNKTKWCKGRGRELTQHALLSTQGPKG